MSDPTATATTTATPVWPARTQLGEGALWHADSQRLFLVDIRQPAVLAWDPTTGTGRRWPMPQPLGWLIPSASGGWIAGFQQGVARLRFEGLEDLAPPQIDWLCRLHPADSPLRLNDAKADAQGRLWFGSMNGRDEDQPDGAFMRLDPDGTLHQIETGYCVSNGPALSPDGRTLLHSDSMRRVTYAFDLDPATGALGPRRLWRAYTGPVEQEGYPDGMCFDAEGCVWVARWGAACVTRLDPQGRELLRVHTGATHTSNCAFGGKALRDLYITTARDRLSPDVLATQPNAGQLLVLRNAGPGLPAGVWGG